MKPFAILSALLTVVAAAVLRNGVAEEGTRGMSDVLRAHSKRHLAPRDPASLAARAPTSIKEWLDRLEAETINAPPGPNVEYQTAQFFKEFRSKRVKIRYGPYTAPAAEEGGMAGFRTENIQVPCQNCLLTWMRAGLEYANGDEANINTGVWLHHTAVGNTGRQDPICKNRTSDGSYFFASGNERTVANLVNSGTVKSGYFISTNDTFIMVTELMNTGSAPADMYVTVTYEYLPGPPGIPKPGDTPDDIPSVPSPNTDLAQARKAMQLANERALFKDSLPLYMDVSNCSDSSEVPAEANAIYDFQMAPWSSTITGKAVYVGGHIHDGGTHIDILKNGEIQCRCLATYGQNPQYEDTRMAHRLNMTVEAQTEQHISQISICDDLGEFKTGDQWSVRAYYNTKRYTPMADPRGGLMPLMGISILYAYQT